MITNPFTLKGSAKICYPSNVFNQLFPDDEDRYEEETLREIEENRDAPEERGVDVGQHDPEDRFLWP